MGNAQISGRAKKATDEKIMESLYAADGNISKAAAWLLQNKGIKISDTAIRKRIKRSADLLACYAAVKEMLQAAREKRPMRKIVPKSGPFKTGPAPKVSDAILREAIKKSYGRPAGIIVYINRVFGITIDRQYLSHRIARNPALLEAVKDAEGEILDTAEMELRERIEEGDGACIRFLLRTRGQERGFGYGVHFERKEAELKAWEERLRQKEKELDARGKVDTLDQFLDSLPIEEVMRLAKYVFNVDEHGVAHPRGRSPKDKK